MPIDWKEISTTQFPVLIDFYADGCDSCIAMDGVFQRLKETWEGKVEFMQLDVEEIPQLKVFFAIRSVPTLVLVHQGETKWRRAGLVTVGEIESQLKKVLSK